MFSCASDVAHIVRVLQIDEGCVRLATANALLKLAKSQENPVSADVYLQLALTMQVSLAASLHSLIYMLGIPHVHVSCTYLAHHELESVWIIIISFVTVIVITTYMLKKAFRQHAHVKRDEHSLCCQGIS